MFEVFECTDCKNCISFGFGFRIACGSPKLPADAVYDYAPVDVRMHSAEECDEYNDGEPIHFPETDIDLAVAEFGDDVSSLRKWAEKKGMLP